MRNLKTQSTWKKDTNKLSESSNFLAKHVTILKALADPVRIRIIELLKSEQLCVCHLSQELGLAQPLVSHHLKVLKEAGLINPNRYRYWTYYCLDTQVISEIYFIFGTLAGDNDSCNEDEIPKRPC